MRNIIFAVFVFVSSISFAQDRFERIEEDLLKLSLTTPGLQEAVDLSVSSVPVSEFLRGMGMTHAINIAVDNNVTDVFSNSFTDAKAKDVIVYLCKKFNLDIDIQGTIISVFKVVPEKIVEKGIDWNGKIKFSKENELLTLELKVDTLSTVAEKLSMASGKSIITSLNARNRLVNTFIIDRPFELTLEKLASTNDLTLTKTEDGFYLFDIPTQNAPADSKKGNSNGVGTSKQNIKSLNEGMELLIMADKIGSLSAKNVPIIDVLDRVSKEMGINFFLYEEIKGDVTFYVENLSYENLLDYVFFNSDYTWFEEKSIYFIGNRKQETLRKTSLIKLKYRTVTDVLEIIPTELKTDAEIKPFEELNALVVTSSHYKVQALEEFIESIDQTVPMIVIEVIIIDVNKIATVATGITAGLGSAPAETSGTLTPGLNLNLTSDAINEIISGVNGFGILNLGAVTPDFYINLQALEENGNIDIRSTPKLATLNGHEATMKIGNTEYYLEVANNVIGSQNPQNIITQTYKSVNADLAITIKPNLSVDEFVTLQIEVNQSDFTGRISANAPPGSVTRNFKSLVRVKNGEMVLLGGLEEKKDNLTYSGLPGIAKIPVLRWFFGKRTMDKGNSKLNIFLKSTIIY
jgi:type IV pilus assembly protein PilQ